MQFNIRIFVECKIKKWRPSEKCYRALSFIVTVNESIEPVIQNLQLRYFYQPTFEMCWKFYSWVIKNIAAT